MIIYNEEKKELIIPTGIGNIDNTIYYDEGFTDGYSSGRTDGYHEGYGNGYNNGRQDVLDSLTSPAIYYDADWEGLDTINPEPPSLGMRSVKVHAQGYGNAKYNEGYNQGFNDGHESGFTEGYTNGFNDGHESGYTDGYADGYASGFTDGYNSGQTKEIVFDFPLDVPYVADYITVSDFYINGVYSPVEWSVLFFTTPHLWISGFTYSETITGLSFTVVGLPHGDFPETLGNPKINDCATVEIASQNRELLAETEAYKSYKYTLTFNDAPVYDKRSYDAGLAACQNNENQ